MIKEGIYSYFWKEEAEANDPFTTRKAYCVGHDVYGDILPNANLIDYLYLLLKKEGPDPTSAKLFEKLAMAVANPGPRDPSVHAGMSAGICGSPNASALMAALGVGAGLCGGAHEVYTLMKNFSSCGDEKKEIADIWPKLAHTPGQNPHGLGTATVIKETLGYLAPFGKTLTLLNQQDQDNSLTMTAVFAAGMHDLGFTPDQGEMLYLYFRLPGVIAHTLEQKEIGFKKFPFFKESVNLL